VSDSATDPCAQGIVPSQPEAVAGYSMTILGGEGCPEAAARWSARSDALAAWLLAEWRKAASSDYGEARG